MIEYEGNGLNVSLNTVCAWNKSNADDDDKFGSAHKILSIFALIFLTAVEW